MVNPNKPLIKLIYTANGTCLGYGYFRRPGDKTAVLWEYEIRTIQNIIKRIKKAKARSDAYWASKM